MVHFLVFPMAKLPIDFLNVGSLQVVDVDNVRQRVTVKLIPRIDLQALASKLVWIFSIVKGENGALYVW